MKKKKILIFSDWYKPGYKAGGPIQSISNLVNLVGSIYDFYIITRNTDYLENEPYVGIKSNEWIKRSNENVYYLSGNQHKFLSIYSLVKEVKPDLIYLNSLYSFHYTLIPILLSVWLKIKVVLAVRGMLSKGSFNVKRNKKDIFLKIFKFLKLQNKILFQATSLSEIEDIKNRIGPQTAIRLANNVPFISFERVYTKVTDRLKVVFVGRIAPEKNLLFAIQVITKVKVEVEFDIYGPIYNNSYWMQCKEIIEHYNGVAIINYKGVLDHENLNDKLKSYDILFLPSTGENFGHTINESMMNCCIPLISDQTPWKDLELSNAGYDLSLNNENDFVEKIEYLASLDKDQLKEMALNAYDFAIKKHDVNSLETSYKLLFN